MSPMSPLLLLCLLVVPSVSATLFVLNGQFTCDLPGPFHVILNVIEDDFLTKDYLHIEHFVSVNTVAYNLTFTIESDGLFDTTFELQLKTVHDCNSDEFAKGPLTFWKTIGKYSVDDGVQYIHVADTDLTDWGYVEL